MSTLDNNRYILITNLEHSENRNLKRRIGTLDCMQSEQASNDDCVAQCRSGQPNKVILLRKVVASEKFIELSEDGSIDCSSSSQAVQNESLLQMDEIDDDKHDINNHIIDDQLDKSPKEITHWLKSFRPLPLYYTERGKPYLKCPACGAMFFTSTSFQRHLFSHMYKDMDIYCCSFCNYTNKEPGMLFAHLSKHQDQCECCNENLMRKNNFEKHRDACLPSFTIKRDRRCRFVCAACKLVFDLLSQLEKHWFRHACKKEKIHQCKECWGLYDTKETLHNHKCLKCPVCGEIYDSLHRLKAHTMWTKHYLKCPICSYEFILTMDHEKHLALHRQIYRPIKDQMHCLQAADGKSFQCNLCDKLFYSLPRVVAHLEEDHGFAGVKKEAEECILKVEVEEPEEEELDEHKDIPPDYNSDENELNSSGADHDDLKSFCEF